MSADISELCTVSLKLRQKGCYGTITVFSLTLSKGGKILIFVIRLVCIGRTLNTNIEISLLIQQ